MNIRKMSWADTFDDDDDNDAFHSEGKSTSSTSTLATTSPKQSWADITDDDISEGYSEGDGKFEDDVTDTGVTGALANDKVFADLPGVSVEVTGMPRELCTRMFLDAMLSQVDLEDSVCGHHISEDACGCVATLKFKTRQAAVKCHKHFQTCSWSTGTLRVVLGTEAAPVEDDSAETENWLQATADSPDNKPSQTAVNAYGSVGFPGSFGGWQQQGAGSGAAWKCSGFEWTYQLPSSAQSGQELGEAWPMEYEAFTPNAFHPSTKAYQADAKTHEMMLARARAYANVGVRARVKA